MKKLYSLIALFAISAAMVLNAQNRVVQIMKDGNVLQSYPVGQIDSIIIVEEFTPEAVDLGLSVKWASCNVGATSPEEYGGYYAWGETEEKSSYTLENYNYYDSNTNELQDIGSNISGTSYDVAYVKWGGSWRMPTMDEFKELCNKCSWEWTSIDNIDGYKVTGINGNSIFIPVAGRRGSKDIAVGVSGLYWSGTEYYTTSSSAWHLLINSSEWDYNCTSGRQFGQSVRPVTK